jgi:hypothetical protein
MNWSSFGNVQYLVPAHPNRIRGASAEAKKTFLRKGFTLRRCLDKLRRDLKGLPKDAEAGRRRWPL